jgi:hypothetical protein
MKYFSASFENRQCVEGIWSIPTKGDFGDIPFQLQVCHFWLDESPVFLYGESEVHQSGH